MNRLLILAALLCSVAHAADFTCLPTQAGGSGTKAVYGVKLSPTVEMWAGWWCDKATPQLMACTGDGCTQYLASVLVPGFLQAPTRTTKTANNILGTLSTDDIDSPVLRSVWVPHWPEILAIKPQ